MAAGTEEKTTGLLQIPVQGMTCATCVARVEKRITS